MESNLAPPETSAIERSDTDHDRRPQPPIMDRFSFTECAKQTHSLRALFELLVNCATEEGFGEVAYGALNFVEPLRLAEYPPPTVAVKWPPDWCERYFKHKYHTIDPVVRRTPMLLRPFLWDQLANHYELQPDERRVLDEAREAGLKHGMSVPLFGPLGRVSVVSFASPSDDVDPQDRIGHLNALASLFHTAHGEIARPCNNGGEKKVTLSQREITCMRWVAEGKSSWEIGVILEISLNTVNFHIKNAMRKLGATTRIQAVAIAIRLNVF
ncbi:DNA-binding CsgD family transcriptional regulator [Bradyrhizobium japonicum]|uniref:DNA-binding CsgD family transcriptional regulator n=2 Tax=Nitrobacteraceae TaxID=41294 RepID=A0A4Y3ZQD7_BRAEL|nr:LuxR family quorum-sensing system transcriptional regulator CciR [Bradyrhizobium elkanii]MCS4007250.1 LuxR family quorum-sensing system transcriptional regulator CciR [Bradyrhizobium elkanii USDA 61]MBP2428772.1 LuxR family quorum-sensing system transcriptional regulator CciR [Bradyrhizobium elkanii]MCP1729005.1 LuxR family quorum-sensing system transcriptional regulator CciR [Bradyrhizobium elkanii]MCP1755747.1 LuxR family quorum-sensing system transcriptional regulator CciR [Bradyrhizobium